MVMAEEFVKAVITVPAAIPGPDTAQPTIVALKSPAEAMVAERFVVTAVATDCCAWTAEMSRVIVPPEARIA
jgi:hypothetical protein